MRTDAKRALMLVGLAIASSLFAGTRDDLLVAHAASVPSAYSSLALNASDPSSDDGGLLARSASPRAHRSTVASSLSDSPPSPSPTDPPRTQVPVAVVRAAQSAPPVAPSPAATCPAQWFCYPRLGIRGPIVPYTDCYGTSDVGTDIRAFTCLSPRYLMGHAYTQMGRITQWRAGDVVYAYGVAFTVTGAITSRSCDPPRLPLAALSMQTSLSSSACGDVLVVQAR